MVRTFANKFWVLERDQTRLLLVVRRTEEPYARIEDIRPSFAELETALNAYNRKHFVLLIDMRPAPQRNDPAYEREASYQPSVLCRGFIRAAVLIKTASGRLQVNRHIRTFNIPMEMFNDEGEAMRYLLNRPA